MKNEGKKEKMIQTQSPQQALEKILSAEILVAAKISDARDRGEKQILEAQNKLIAVKTDIVESARVERDQMIKAGINESREDAERTIHTARLEAEEFFENGRKFLDEAAELVLHTLLGNNEETK
ncbi:MAG: hypothetical protein FJZ98_04400 [Chloroflexi bacterium]|nr:hypothetical protein [Chloroflexota bacterium]